MLRDADIREPLFEFLDEEYGKIRIIEEKTIGKSRADVFMVTENALFGLEIKSDADSYTRLAGQVKDYDKFYDYNYVVVGTSHALHIEEHVPAYWGIITVEEIDGTADFYILRRPTTNPKVSLKNKLRFLWRPELAVMQIRNDMPKYKDKGKDFVIEKILERTEYPEGKKGRLETDILSKQICEILFERDYNDVSATLREYYKGELQKKIEAESNPQKRLELMLEQEKKRKSVRGIGFKKKRGRRKRR